MIRSIFHCLNPCQIILDQRKNKIQYTKGIDILHQTVLVRMGKDLSFSLKHLNDEYSKTSPIDSIFNKKSKIIVVQISTIPSLSNVINSKECQHDIPKVTNN